MQNAGPKYIPVSALLRRYGIASKSTVYRWERDPDMGFPTPVFFGQRKFYDLAELEAWEARQPRGPLADSEAA